MCTADSPYLRHRQASVPTLIQRIRYKLGATCPRRPVSNLISKRRSSTGCRYETAHWPQACCSEWAHSSDPATTRRRRSQASASASRRRQWSRPCPSANPPRLASTASRTLRQAHCSAGPGPLVGRAFLARETSDNLKGLVTNALARRRGWGVGVI